MKFQTKALIGALSACLMIGSASAATVSGTMTNTAVVVPECAVSVADLSFGNIGLLTSAKNASSNMAVICNTPLAYNIQVFDAADSAKTAFAMASGVNEIGFGLYQDAARTQVLDKDNVLSGSAATGNTNQNITLYGQIPVQVSKPAGAYTVAMRAQINF